MARRNRPKKRRKSRKTKALDTSRWLSDDYAKEIIKTLEQICYYSLSEKEFGIKNKNEQG